MRFYRFTDRLFPKSYVLKLYAAAFLGTHVPLAAIGALILAGRGAELSAASILAAALLATLAGTAFTLVCLRLLLTPILATERALRRYEKRRDVQPLPEDHADEAGRLMAATGRMIRQAEEALRAAEAAAFTDPLTGALNRRGLEKLTPRGAAGAFLMIDADRFKALNDAHGHEAGDRALKAIARTIRGTARQGDLTARIGGEEFVVFLPDADLMEAMQVGERIRAAVARSVRVEGEAVTVSIGAASGGAGPKALAATLKGADAALYAAKRAGRNKVTPWLPRPEFSETMTGEVEAMERAGA